MQVSHAGVRRAGHRRCAGRATGKMSIDRIAAGRSESRAIGREFGVWLVTAGLYAALWLWEPSFRGWSNFRNVLTEIAMIAIVAVGMTAVILTGGIDLSVGSIAAVGACLSGVLMVRHGMSGLVGILVTLGVGLLLGLFNGLSITKVGLPPFIATLASMVMARGLAFVISGGGAVYGLPPSYLWAGSANLIPGIAPRNNLPAMVVLMAALFLIVNALLRRTSLGRHIYAVGANEEASRLSGISVVWVKSFCYGLVGLLSGLAGMLYAGYVGAAEPTIGDGMELDVIAAVVIGGTSLSGGQGSLPGTFAGALLIGLVRNGLNLMQVDSNYQKVAVGAIIYLAVMIDMWQKKRRRA
jgi:ribose transport system permease protein